MTGCPSPCPRSRRARLRVPQGPAHLVELVHQLPAAHAGRRLTGGLSGRRRQQQRQQQPQRGRGQRAHGGPRRAALRGRGRADSARGPAGTAETPGSGRPPAPPPQRFPGLLDGAGWGPAPRQSSRRYWSAGSALSLCGPIRVRHEKRPIGRPRVSVPRGRGGSRGLREASPALASTSLGGHLYSGQAGGLRPRRRPGFGGHVSFGQGLRLGPRFPLPRFRPTAVETAALGGEALRG